MQMMRGFKKSVGLAMTIGTLVAVPQAASAYDMYGMYPIYGGMYSMVPMSGYTSYVPIYLYSMYGAPVWGMIGMPAYPVSGMYPMYAMNNYTPILYSMYLESMLSRGGMVRMWPMYGNMMAMYPVPMVDYRPLMYSMSVMGMGMNQPYIVGGMYPMYTMNYTPILYSMYLESMLRSGMGGGGMYPMASGMAVGYSRY